MSVTQQGFHAVRAVYTGGIDSRPKFLIAAKDDCLQTIRIDQPETWNDSASCPTYKFSASADNQISEAVSDEEEDTKEPKAKKQKLNKAEPQNLRVVLLRVTRDSEHVVCVTDSDKCVRVLSINPDDGTLTESSQRCMPKRPCAIDISHDNTRILCGDKFGDVYSLPLIPSTTSTIPTPNPAVSKRAEPARLAATELTVHTQRNRRALEEQKRQRERGNAAPPKQGLAFEHKLILGHISMLTDLCVTTSPNSGPDETGAKKREYIITSDRDEHIRVSRGEPQAHIIHGFCLGHTKAVTKVCPLVSLSKESKNERENILLSGGGDDWLGVWEYTTGKLLAKRDLSLIRPEDVMNEKEKDEDRVEDASVTEGQQGDENNDSEKAKNGDEKNNVKITKNGNEKKRGQKGRNEYNNSIKEKFGGSVDKEDGPLGSIVVQGIWLCDTSQNQVDSQTIVMVKFAKGSKLAIFEASNIEDETNDMSVIDDMQDLLDVIDDSNGSAVMSFRGDRDLILARPKKIDGKWTLELGI